MQNTESKAARGVDRDMVYRALAILSLAVGVFLSGPFLVGQELVNWVLQLSPERASLLILVGMAVVVFVRGFVALALIMLGFLVSGAACHQYFALDAAAMMGGIGILFLMIGIGVLIFNSAR